MASIDDLRSAIAQVGVDLAEAVTRIETKIDSLGGVDPDLTTDIAALRGFSFTLDGIAADPDPVPGSTPVEGPGDEEAVTEPPLPPGAE